MYQSNAFHKYFIKRRPKTRTEKEDPSWDPQHPHKSWKWHRVPVTPALESRDRWILRARWPASPAELVSFRFTERSCLKK